MRGCSCGGYITNSGRTSIPITLWNTFVSVNCTLTALGIFQTSVTSLWWRKWFTETGQIITINTAVHTRAVLAVTQLPSPPPTLSLSLSLVHTHTHPHARSRRHGHTQRASLVLCITAPALSFVPFFRGFRSLSLSLSLSLPACLSLSLCLSVCEESLLVVCVSLPRIVRDDPRPRLQLHLSLATHMFCSVPKLVVAVTPRPP